MSSPATINPGSQSTSTPSDTSAKAPPKTSIHWGFVVGGVALAILAVASLVACVALAVFFPPSVLLYASSAGVAIMLGLKLATGGLSAVSLIASLALFMNCSHKTAS